MGHALPAMKSSALVLLGLALCPGILCQPPAPQHDLRLGYNGATFEGLGMLPGGDHSEAAAVSGDGNVAVGWSTSASGKRAFRSEGGAMSAVGILPGTSDSFANGVSRDGSVIVGACEFPDPVEFSPTSPQRAEAVRWTADAGILGLDDAAEHSTIASSVSADGSVIVGSIEDRCQGCQIDTTSAFRWTSEGGLASAVDSALGHLSIASDISADGSVIVGTNIAYDSSRTAVRSTLEDPIGELGRLPGGTNSQAVAVSADGAVIVGSSTSFNRPYTYGEAFRWTAQEGMVGLGVLYDWDLRSMAVAVSGDGEIIVGKSYTPLETAAYLPSSQDDEIQFGHAFIWDRTHGMRSLSDVLTNDHGLDLSGWQLSEATGISDDGLTIVGTGINPNGQPEAWIAHLPAPTP